mmetsp:Transcript_18721/g.52909  ORF Transcript_18721/g.52909 Transcript_18721/m.52909 type:complete len:230 (-) Transcript_18721:68-757(-)
MKPAIAVGSSGFVRSRPSVAAAQHRLESCMVLSCRKDPKSSAAAHCSAAEWQRMFIVAKDQSPSTMREESSPRSLSGSARAKQSSTPWCRILTFASAIEARTSRERSVRSIAGRSDKAAARPPQQRFVLGSKVTSLVLRPEFLPTVAAMLSSSATTWCTGGGGFPGLGAWSGRFGCSTASMSITLYSGPLSIHAGISRPSCINSSLTPFSSTSTGFGSCNSTPPLVLAV